MFGSKGISFTLESVIAGLLIVSALLFLFRAAPLEDTYDVGMAERGYNCLKGADLAGVLRNEAMDNESAAIEANLQDCLAGLNYTVQVCRESCTSAYAEENVTVAVSEYFIAGNVTIDPLYVRLSMWL